MPRCFLLCCFVRFRNSYDGFPHTLVRLVESRSFHGSSSIEILKDSQPDTLGLVEHFCQVIDRVFHFCKPFGTVLYT